jgi:hypothetical protein
MKTRHLSAKLLLIALTAAAFAHHAAHAQGIWGMAAANASFDARMAAINNYHMQQNLNSQRQLRQQHLQQNLPRLQAGYRQYLASGQRGTFAQYVEWDLMTAAGTNVAGAIKAQNDRYAGIVRANETVKSGFASYNAGAADNSRRTSAAIGNWTTGAVRGNAYYVNPNTGARTELPYYLAPGHTVNNGGNTYAQDPQGNYYQQHGNYWTPMSASR